jgi:DNA-binding MarR family transcriptional regulator
LTEIGRATIEQLLSLVKNLLKDAEFGLSIEQQHGLEASLNILRQNLAASLPETADG